MNKVLFAGLIVGCISSASAQVSIGPLAGGHFAKYSERIDGKKVVMPQYKFTRNWRLGIAANIPINTHWALQPSATYATNYAIPPKKVPKNQQVNPNALEIPISIAYKFTPHDNTLMVSAGPYVAYHFKTHETGPGYGTGSTGKMYPLFTRLNLGVNATVGYEWHTGWFLKGYFQRVLTGMYSNAIYKTYPTPLNATYLTNFNFGLTVGYFFKRHSKNEAGIDMQQQR